MNIVFCFHTTDYEYNLGIALLTSTLKSMDVNTSLVIFREIVNNPVKDTAEETVQRILEKKPDIAAFSTMTFNWKKIQKVITLLRLHFSGLIVVGGCHAMLCPDEVLSFPGVDAVCLGDGEKPMQELVRLSGKHAPDSLPPIEGLRIKSNAWQHPGKPWCNERIEDYPYLDFEDFNEERNQPLSSKVTGHFSFAGLFILPAITSRGCPYKCTYCNNYSFMNILGGPGRYLRTYSVKRVISEIKGLVDLYKPEFIDFMDEMFLKQTSWMREFCEAYSREINLPFSVNVRIDRCNEENVSMLADSGLKLVLFGLECGDEIYRAKYLNRHMSNPDILRGAEILRRHNVVIITYNMFGMPCETPEILQKTISLNRQIRPDAIAPFIFQPLPQTRLGRMAYEHGMVQPPPEDRWDYLAPALDSDVLPAKYVQEQVELFRQEFNSPERVQTVINKIRSFAGKKPL